MADRRASSADPGSAVAIGLFRTTARTLRDPTACPNGTHTDAQATTCWPTTQLVRTGFRVLSGPHLAVDERTSGTGAGNVYLVFSEFNVPVDDKRLLLVACTNSLVTCAAPVTVTVAPDSIGLQVSQVAVRPDGQITILWTSGDFAGMSIAYHSCTPAVPPTAPRCGSLSGVHSWDPISVAETLATYPQASSSLAIPNTPTGWRSTARRRIRRRMWCGISVSLAQTGSLPGVLPRCRCGDEGLAG